MLERMKLGAKIALSFVILSVVAIAIGSVALAKMSQQKLQEDKIYKTGLTSAMALSDITGGVEGAKANEGDLLNRRMFADIEIRRKSLEAHATHLQLIAKGVQTIEPLLRDGEEKQAWGKFKPALESWLQKDGEFMELAEKKAGLLDGGAKSEDQAVVQLDNDILQKSMDAEALYEQADEPLSQMNEAVAKAADASGKAYDAEAEQARILIFALMGIGVLISITLGTYFIANVKDIVGKLLGETRLLAEAGVNGQLATRGDTDSINFEFRPIVQGFNDTLDAVIGPLNVSAEYVDRISKGDIPLRITDEYKGDFNEIKNNLNQCIDAVNLLVSDINLLALAAVEGRMDSRADSANHRGDFGRIVGGVNKTLDTVLEPIEEAAAVLEKVAARDLSARVEGKYRGDHAAIKNNLNKAIDNLDEALAQVARAVDQVGSASTQIAGGSQSLAEGANEQASSLQEVSSSLEEMSSMTKQNADNASKARVLSEESRKSAEAGNTGMQRMNDAIQKIRVSADQTAKIIKTIDEIAFQTNLLALNAAVEAARAGDAGKGFAVVAEEVRNLAQRSAEAAKNTANLIEESVENAKGGVAITEEVGKALNEIVDGVNKVTEIIGEIAAASKEQAQGIEQVAVAVNQMNKVTQGNAANTEESASAAQELSCQAQELAVMVGSFNLTSESIDNSRMIRKSQASRQAHGAMDGLKGKVSEMLYHAHEPAGAGASAKGGARSRKPEHVIPLTDDDLGTF